MRALLSVVLAVSAAATQTIPELAQATPTLSTLETFLGAADLVSTLNGAGPFTVFAPTNAAFDALPKGLVSALLKPENEAQLVELLTYHVANGEALTGPSYKRIRTLQGTNVTMRDVDWLGGRGVWINDANVTTPDVVASNGVVHIIDKVLIPAGWWPTWPSTAKQTIPELAQATPTLSFLATALRATNLVSTLNGTGPFTVFAPTNAAFNLLGGWVPASLRPEPLASNVSVLLKPEYKAKLVELLTYHVANGKALSGSLMAIYQKIPTLQGTNITAGGTVSNLWWNLSRPVVDVEGSSLWGAVVMTPDLDASNGVVHIIDQVLIPPGWWANWPSSSPSESPSAILPSGSPSESPSVSVLAIFLCLGGVLLLCGGLFVCSKKVAGQRCQMEPVHFADHGSKLKAEDVETFSSETGGGVQYEYQPEVQVAD